MKNFASLYMSHWCLSLARFLMNEIQKLLRDDRQSRHRFLKRVGDSSVQRMVHVAMAEIRLKGARVGALKAAGMSEHTRVRREAQLGRDALPPHHPAPPRRRDRG